MAALHSNDPARAIAILEAARPYELAVNALAFLNDISALYPPFLRGEAYLAQGKKTEAAAEFRRILSHRGLLQPDPIGLIIERELATLSASQPAAAPRP
jgi:eukaryotic-like serine/threonine-protein kinase